MPSEYYRDALKRAQKEFRSCTAKGEYPYLPVLDEFVSQEDLLRTVDLGTIQKNIENHVILTRDDFAIAVRKVFDNAFLYNKPQDDV